MYGSQGRSGAPGEDFEKLATSTTSLVSRYSDRASSADQTSDSPGVLAQPAATSSATATMRGVMKAKPESDCPRHRASPQRLAQLLRERREHQVEADADPLF